MKFQTSWRGAKQNTIEQSQKTQLSGVFRFFRRLKMSATMMTRMEKVLVAILLILSMCLSVLHAKNEYMSVTTVVADDGGTYSEVIAGEFKYFDPVLAQSDADKSVTRLLFSGLVKFDRDGIKPDLAERWEVSPDGKRYTFYLRNDVSFHNGIALTATDVVTTLDRIKSTPESPLNVIWKDVKVTATGDYQVVFDLPKAFGPFIYNCDFSVVPSSISQNEFAKKFIGTGPYVFASSKMEKDRILEVRLTKNARYFGDKPKIGEIALAAFSDPVKAKDAFSKKEYDAISGTNPGEKDLIDVSFRSAKRLELLINSRQPNLKDKEVRRKLLATEKFDAPLSLSLVTLNTDLQKNKALELKNRFAEQNVAIDVRLMTPLQLKQTIDNKQYDLLLYGFDFGYDQDPYLFWHSSQMDKMNYAGYSNKDSDMFLEDARVITDQVERQNRYNQFFASLAGEYLYEAYEPITNEFFVRSNVKGIEVVRGYEFSSRYDKMAQWYVKEKRVRK